MSINNKTLLYQLKEHFGNSIPIDLLPLLVSVNEVYNGQHPALNYPDDAIVKVKSKTKTAVEYERLKLHFSIVQQSAKAGSYEFDFPEHTSAEQKMTNDAHVYYFSDEVYRIMGLQPGSHEISKDFFFPQLNPYDLSIILENSNDSNLDIKQYEEEQAVKMPDGSERIVLKKSDIFFGKNSLSPTKIIGTVQDVTEVRGLENDLRKAKREKESILQNLFNAYLSYDVINNKVLFSNNAFQKIFEGTPLQNNSGEASFMSIIQPEDKINAYALLRKLAKGTSATYNFRIELNSGGYRWLESRLVPTLGRDGRLMVIELIANDVTAWKNTEKSAAEVRASLQQELFSVGEVVLLLGSDLVVTYASENVSRLLGCLPGDLSGKLITDFVCADDIEKVSSFYKSVVPGTRESTRLSFRFRHTGGHEVWCESVASNMSDNSLIGGIIARVRDITFFKEQESQLVSTVADLKKANANLEDFVSVVSHDLRAPLNSIRGILDLIDMKEESQELADELNYLRGSVNNLDEFIIDLLNYSRCTRSDHKAECLSLETVLDNTANFLKFMSTQDKPVEFMKDVQCTVPFHSDPKLITIVFNNLISNAIRYSNPDAAEPFVAVRINADAECARIEVVDNGIGIAAEDLPKIFDMFYRVSNDRNGTGIGLHLVKLAVEKLSGEISVYSEKGTGTRFSILLPNMLNNKTNQNGNHNQ